MVQGFLCIFKFLHTTRLCAGTIAFNNRFSIVPDFYTQWIFNSSAAEWLGERNGERPQKT